MNKVIQLANLAKSFTHKAGSNQVLNQVNLDVDSGDMVAIVGQSGSGKSTLLSIIGLLDVASSGEFFLCGTDVSSLSSYQLSQLRNRHIGWVFQNFNLISDMTVAENLAVPLTFNTDILKAEYASLIETVLDKVGLSDRSSYYPDELSGGQQQRVAIARALICSPDILLCDEPTGNLDEDNSKKIMELLSALNREGRTILLITHDKEVAAACSKTYQINMGGLELAQAQEFKHAV